MLDPEACKPLNPMVQTTKKNCPDWIGIGVRNESESVSGMDRNHCPKIIGMGVRNGLESVSGMARNTHLISNDLAKCILKKDFHPKTFIENLTNLLPLLICPNRKHRPTSLEIVAMFDKI